MRPFRVFAAVAVLSVLFAAPSALAKQCVFNKGGYVLNVQWYRPVDLFLNTGSTVRPLYSPVEQANLAVGQGHCTSTADVLTALVSIDTASTVICGVVWPGGWNSVCTLRYLAGTLASQTMTCANERGCAGTMNVTLPSANYHKILLFTPPADRYWDFWGSTTTIQYGPGGPIPQ